MQDRTGHHPANCAATAFLLLLMGVVPAWPQAAPPSLGVQSPTQQPAAAPPQPEPAAPPAREENPGLINELGKLWDKSISALPKIKSPSETFDDLSNMAKPSTMVTGRMACVVSSNGAADCKLGADRLCQSKGYKDGKSLDTDAVEKCAPKAYIPGRQRQPGDCKTESYVIKALCQ
ncbi:MAG: hypothetical protein ACRC1G_11350 [Bradyrhizobium sp.]|nr:hypothetical protein [Bradyrhizobium sp.]